MCLVLEENPKNIGKPRGVKKNVTVVEKEIGYEHHKEALFKKK